MVGSPRHPVNLNDRLCNDLSSTPIATIMHLTSSQQPTFQHGEEREVCERIHITLPMCVAT